MAEVRDLSDVDAERPLRVIVAGDVFPNLENGEDAFRDLRPLLSTGDIVVGNCEGVYTDRPAPAPSHKHLMVAPRERGAELGAAPFHVMSLANNHMMDGGYVGLGDTMDLLRSQGIAVTGAGGNRAEATAPAIVERRGIRVGVLGFCAVFPVGYEARPNRPGIAAVRVRTFYADPDPNFWEPGIAPEITEIPVQQDVAAFRQAIASAREQVDVLIVLGHWGYSSRLESIQRYEQELAQEAVRAGASAVLCAHHHSLRGVEFSDGAPIYYGLGTLVHHLTTLYPPSDAELARRRRMFGDHAHIPDPEFPLFPFHEDARQSGVAVLEVGKKGVLSAGFVPAMIRADGSTEPLRVGDERGEAIASYLERISGDAKFETTFARSELEELLLVSAAPRMTNGAAAVDGRSA